MLKLDLKSEAYWLDLADGLRVFVHPMRTSLMRRAREDVRAQMDPEQDAPAVDQLMNDLTLAVARQAIIGWDGVADQTGNPVDVTPEYLTAFMDQEPVFQAFKAKYVLAGLRLESEGNG